MKNQVQYLEKIIRLLRTLKKDDPNKDISSIISLSTDCKGLFLTDKELYESLKEYQYMLDTDYTNLDRKDILEILEDTEGIFNDSYLLDEHEDWD